MKSKLTLTVFSLLLAIFLAGCSKKSSSNANANSNSANSNTTATTTENENLEPTDLTTDDSSTTTKTDKSKSTDKTAGGDKTSNGNAPKTKPTPDKEPPTKSAEKKARKQGDRVIRDSGEIIKEGERRVRGILDGKP